MFATKLKQAMRDLGLNQTHLAALLGVSKASVSQYLSGKQVPTDPKKASIAEAMGLDRNYFFEATPATQIKIQQAGAISRITPTDAARLMGMSPRSVQLGLQQSVFPWGYAIKTSDKKWTYFINARRFAEIEGITLPDVAG